MPQTLSDETFKALADIVRNVDFRAKRLLEWRTLLLQTQVSEGRFDVFLAKHKAANDPPDAAQLRDLDNAWEDCDRSLMELAVQPDGLQAITLALADGSADPTVRAWIDELAAAGKNVKTALANRSFNDLKNNLAAYKAAYTKLAILRDAKVQVEVNQLAGLTNSLKNKFDGGI